MARLHARVLGSQALSVSPTVVLVLFPPLLFNSVHVGHPDHHHHLAPRALRAQLPHHVPIPLVKHHLNHRLRHLAQMRLEGPQLVPLLELLVRRRAALRRGLRQALELRRVGGGQDLEQGQLWQRLVQQAHRVVDVAVDEGDLCADLLGGVDGRLEVDPRHEPRVAHELVQSDEYAGERAVLADGRQHRLHALGKAVRLAGIRRHLLDLLVALLAQLDRHEVGLHLLDQVGHLARRGR
mmetsp:Transcript_9485/g.31553  ORF Transcript_9485/g.31553 Transcript_9485/m.31553 type:complete len:238 (+) Transcript_9485:70-783(+)